MTKGQRRAECNVLWEQKQCATMLSEVLKMKMYKMSPVQNDFLHFRILTSHNFHISFSLFELLSLSMI
jgi:hypothetical protein